MSILFTPDYRSNGAMIVSRKAIVINMLITAAILFFTKTPPCNYISACPAL